MKRFLSALVVALALWAQPASAWTLCDHKTTTGTASTAAMNTATGCSGSPADLITIAVSEYVGGIPGSSPHDSASNTWAKCGTTTTSGETDITIWYKQAPTTNGSHTFDYPTSNAFPSVYAQAWSGSASTPCNATNQAGSSGTSLATGSIAPNSSDLVLTAGSFGSGSSSQSVSGYTAIDAINYGNGVNEGGGVSWTTGVTSTNPTWSWSGSAVASVAVASFLGTGGGGGGGSAARPCTLRLLGVGCEVSP